MNIQLGSSRYSSISQPKSPKRIADDLFLDNKKKNNAKYEIKKENGYIRHYVTQADGKVVMIKETKLPKSEENEQDSSDIKDLMNDMILHQLTKALDKEQFSKFSKTGLAAQKEKQIQKYALSI
ncbi:hypothetical protein [Bacillus ndiopicus]|uniref:hypothetical protein n=1 Tax=Bacillus ndiopicus TaxID=1347368 RepID=UPI0005A75BEA|nr:hypothetical protein [Bacillus ndiopicus]